MEFILFKINGRPLIALPKLGSFSFLISAINCLPSFTLKKKIFKIYMYLIVFIGCFISRKIYLFHTGKEVDVFLEWFKFFQEKKMNKDLYPVVIWSLVPNRNRFYIHLLNSNGKKQMFTKITKNKSDFSLLKNEFTQLEKFESQKNIFSVPNIIDFDFWNDYCYLVVSSIEEKAKLNHPEKNQFPSALNNEIMGDKGLVTLSKIIDQSWWKSFYEKRQMALTLYNYINNQDLNSKINVCFAHGDFGSENILKFEDKFIVIDWERATENAPVCLDKIAYWLGKNHKTIKTKPKVKAKDFFNEFNKVPKLELALSLSFLVGANFNLAIEIANYFEK